MNESFNNNNDNIPNKYKNSIPNTLSNKDKGISDYNKYTPGDQDTIRALNKKDPDEELGTNEKKNLRMNIGRKYKNVSMSKEEIEQKIVNMIHSNLIAKIILNSAIFVFSVVSL